MKVYTKERQQEFIKEHTLTWAQRQKVIESKLERARAFAQLVQKREALLKSW